MGKFLDEVLELSTEYINAKSIIVSNIIKDINKQIKNCAKNGFTAINIKFSDNKIPVLNIKEINDTYVIEMKYKNDKDIISKIIQYYKKEGFFVSDNFDKISWYNVFYKYLKSKQEGDLYNE